MGYAVEIDLFVKNLDALASARMAARAKEIRDEYELGGQSLSGTRAVSQSVVDRSEGIPYEEVRPDGSIVIKFDYRIAVVEDLFLELKVRAPRVSGRYARSFFAQLDGVGLAYMTPPTRDQLRGVRVVTVSNDVPYARRLEVALDKQGNPFVKQVEPHIVERAAIAVRRRWQGLALLKFTYIDLAGGYAGSNALAHYRLRTADRKGRARISGRSARELRQRRIVRYPAIEIRNAA